MKQLKHFIIFILVILTSIYLTSCKKDDFHKIRYEVQIISTPSYGYSNQLIVSAIPNYSQIAESQEPSINYSNVTPGSVWYYDYLQLKKGDRVEFGFDSNQGYELDMNVYIDNSLYMSQHIVPSQTTSIKFTY